MKLKNTSDMDLYEVTQKEYESYHNTPLFVPIALNSNGAINANKRFDDTLTVILVITGIGIATWVGTYRKVCDFLSISPVIAACMYIMIFTLITYFIAVTFIYKIPEKVAERAITGTANKELNLSQVWGIASGGISTEEFFDKLQGVIINFEGSPALLYNSIMTTTDGIPEGADEMHYNCNQKILDTIIRRGYSRYKLNLKYDTSLDPIWSYTEDRIYEASDMLTSEYIDVMATLLNHQYEYTKEKSRVPSVYNIIKLKPNSTIEEVVSLYYEILALAKQGTLYNIKLLNLSDFQTLLQHYYGFLYIDMENVVAKTTIKESLGDSKILSVYTANNNLYQKEPEQVRIDEFFDRRYTEVFNLPEDVITTIKEINIFED